MGHFYSRKGVFLFGEVIWVFCKWTTSILEKGCFCMKDKSISSIGVILIQGVFHFEKKGCFMSGPFLF